MKKSYVDYIIEETQKILAIDSPSGYTQNVADYLMKEYRKLGYEPVQTVKGGVLVKLGASWRNEPKQRGDRELPGHHEIRKGVLRHLPAGECVHPCER